ncbi:hypothetical protein FACS189434_14180 [Bacteroidia bacterium]|nr:hypothetical protein FACS189434_14180 [Bacteroidia bacterium]
MGASYHRGDKGKAVLEINIRLAGFGGMLPTEEFTELTEKGVKQFQQDYMKMAKPTGEADFATLEKETEIKFYINQFCGVNGKHSSHDGHGEFADVRYAHKDGNVNESVSVTSSNYSKDISQKMVNYLRKYGYNNTNSILTENSTGTGKEFENTYFVDGKGQFEHKSHMHIQKYNQTHLK